MPLSALRDVLTASVDNPDALRAIECAGPYCALRLPNFGFLVGYYQEDEPIDPDEQADAWERLELLFPELADVSLAGMIEHHKNGRTVVVELYA